MYKRRKTDWVVEQRLNKDHSEGFYLIKCRDLVEEKTPGQVWVVQSSHGYSNQKYTVTRKTLHRSCKPSCCVQCINCPHQYACTCTCYVHGVIMSCKHTHAISQIVHLKQLGGVKKDGEDQEDGPEAIEDSQEPEVEANDNDYPDFSEPVGLRRFQLRVKGPKAVCSLFINAHMLAELSPRFADLCFDEGFLEKKDVMVEDESYKALLELMRCVFPCSTSTFQCKPVSIHNLALLARFAHKYQIAQLKWHCENFLMTTFKFQQAGPRVVLKILMAVANVEYSKMAVAKVVGRAATYDMQALNRAKLAENLPANIWSVLLEAKKHYRPSQDRVTFKRKGHQIDVDGSGRPITHEEFCMNHGEEWDDRCEIGHCRNCDKEICIKDVDDEEGDDDDDDEYMEECSNPKIPPVASAYVNMAWLH